MSDSNRVPKALGACVVISVVLAFVVPAIAEEREKWLSPDSSLLARFLLIDEEFVSDLNADSVVRMAAPYKERLERCGSTDLALAQRETCIVEGIVGDGGLVGLRTSADPLESSLAGSLSKGAGSCAGLVAAVLALSEDLGSPFGALVLRDHVLLASTSSDRVYELLDNGRLLGENEMVEHRPSTPGGPVRVTSGGFLPYYLDNLAARLAEDGQTESAEAAFRQALDLAPEAARIHYNVGTFLLQLNRYAEAEVHLRRAIKFGWDDAAAFVNRGVARWQQGRLKAARRDFQHALRLDPDNREAKTNLRKLAENPGGD